MIRPRYDNLAKKITRAFFYSLLAIPASGVAYAIYLYFRTCYRSIIDIHTRGIIYDIGISTGLLNPSIGPLIPLGILLICLLIWGFVVWHEWAWRK